MPSHRLVGWELNNLLNLKTCLPIVKSKIENKLFINDNGLMIVGHFYANYQYSIIIKKNNLNF